MRLLRLKEVEEKVGWKKTKIYAMIKEDAFPTPKKFGSVLKSMLLEKIKRHQSKELYD